MPNLADSGAADIDRFPRLIPPRPSPDTERVGHAVEEREQGDHVNGLGDLRLCPSKVAQGLGVIGVHSSRGDGQLVRVTEQGRFGFG